MKASLALCIATLSLFQTLLVSLAASSNGPVISSYFPGYDAWKYPARKFTLAAYTHVDFFVATPNADGSIQDYTIYNIPDLEEAVTLVHGNGSTISITIGGWTGSRYFSTICGNTTLSNTFATNIVNYITQYNLDGVDIDWEYPNTYAAGNIYNSNDVANFLAFLQILRAKAGNSVRISLAVPITGFVGPNNGVVTDVSGFAAVLDYVTLMVYDVYGSWTSVTGPNAPFDGSCGNPADTTTSVKTGVALWTSGGFQSSQIVVGIPAYGHSWYTKSDNLTTTSYNGANSSMLYQPWAKVGKGPNGDDTWRYSELLAQNVLSADGTQAQGNWTRYWDDCSSTPFLFNSQTKLFISYDDPESVGVKASWAASQGLAGVNFFDMLGDTMSYPVLANVARQAFGLSTTDNMPPTGSGPSSSITPAAPTTTPKSSTTTTSKTSTFTPPPKTTITVTSSFTLKSKSTVRSTTTTTLPGPKHRTKKITLRSTETSSSTRFTTMTRTRLVGNMQVVSTLRPGSAQTVTRTHTFTDTATFTISRATGKVTRTSTSTSTQTARVTVHVK